MRILGGCVQELGGSGDEVNPFLPFPLMNNVEQQTFFQKNRKEKKNQTKRACVFSGNVVIYLMLIISEVFMRR